MYRRDVHFVHYSYYFFCSSLLMKVKVSSWKAWFRDLLTHRFISGFNSPMQIFIPSIFLIILVQIICFWTYRCLWQGAAGPFFVYLLSTGGVNWYLGTEQLPSYFQLPESVVATHNDLCGNVRELLWRDKKNLIILCINVTFLLDRAFLSSMSDTVSVQKKKKIFIKMKVHQKVLPHKSQKYVYQLDKVHSIINNSFAFAVTCCCWGSFLTIADGLWKFQNTCYCVFRGHLEGMC